MSVRVRSSLSPSVQVYRNEMIVFMLLLLSLLEAPYRKNFKYTL